MLYFLALQGLLKQQYVRCFNKNTNMTFVVLSIFKVFKVFCKAFKVINVFNTFKVFKIKIKIF